jgi:hypothetical protein
VVVRQKTGRLSDERVACTLVLDREFTPDEISRFYRQPCHERPGPLEFFMEGRVVRYECDRQDEARWRLAFEILLVKAFRESAPARSTGDRTTGIRARAGFRKLHLG